MHKKSYHIPTEETINDLRSCFAHEKTFIPSSDGGLECRSLGGAFASFAIDANGRALVFELWTSPNHRGKGDASALLTAIDFHESKHPLRVVANKKAKGFYKKHNFIEVAPNVFEMTY